MARADVSETDGVNRRAYLAALAGAGAAGLAGCTGDDTDGDDDDPGGGSGASERGERVPEIGYEFTTGLGQWSAVEESTAEIVSQNFEDALGVPVEARGKEAFTMWEEQIADERTAHIYAGGFSPTPVRLDPYRIMDLFHIRNAGAENAFNKTQYHNCEFSEKIEDLAFAPTEEDRKQAAQEAFEIASEDVATVPIMPTTGYGAINTDFVEPDEEIMGRAGISNINLEFLINMESADGESLSIDAESQTFSSTVHPLITNANEHNFWSHFLYSPLMRYDSEYESVPYLASDFEVEDEFKTITFELRDHTFHNGEPVTAEDVKFSFELYNDDPDSTFFDNWTYESIEVIDDRTVEFNFNIPSGVWLRTSQPHNIGILPKDHWVEAGAEDGLQNVELDEVIGCGPFELGNFRQGELLQLEPNEDHWETPSQGLNIVLFQDAQSAFRDFEAGDLPVFLNPSAGMARDIEEMDNAVSTVGNQFMISSIAPQMSHGPGMFREFRLALSQCIDRREASQVGTYGDAEPILHSCIVAPEHPWYPDDHEGLTQIAPSPEGDAETARETLEAAGWSWDDDGNLHYPPDADLSPRWPEGSSPMEHPDEFPCVEDIPENMP